MPRLLSTFLSLILLPMVLQAQKNDPPKVSPPNDAQRKAIEEKQEQLRAKLGELKQQRVSESVVPSVEIYLKASEWILRYNEFWHAEAVKWTLSILDQGMKRADEAKAGKTPWLEPSTRSTARAYRSRIDGSVQPYAITFPPDYGKVDGKKYRLDLVLHGRDATLTEVKFLNTHNGTREPLEPRAVVQIDVYGRGNNAYRWAGEEDVFEALQHALATEKEQGRGDRIDPNRVVLRGFSMGGAGTWHIGLHHPSKFLAIGPGAGFTTTHGYIKGLPDPLPSPQEETLRIYDAVHYAENAYGLPVVAYSGGNDPQKAAADNIEARLRDLKITSMTHLVAPGLEHKFPPEWQKYAEVEFAKYAKHGRNPSPDEIQFTTYTLKYPSRDWIELRGLDKHYELAQIVAKKTGDGVTIQTKGVRSFAIRQEESKSFKQIEIDGKRVSRTGPNSRFFAKKDGNWITTESEDGRLQKRPGLQGPIDDAFTGSFIAADERGPLSTNRQLANVLGKAMDTSEQEWRHYFRGNKQIKDVDELTETDLEESHLEIWGDPESNPFLAKLMPKLPFKWTAETIEFGGEKYDAKTHYLALIYPNPLNPKRYVVINSGHTFHEAELKGTNAQLYPRWGDYAVIKMTPTEKDKRKIEVVRSGLFNEFWEVEPARK